MAVVIDSGELAATYLLHEVPRDKWRKLMELRRQYLEHHLNTDCRRLVEFVDDAAVMYEHLGFASVEQMVREGYRLEPEEIDIAVRWLKLNPPSEPISLETVNRLALHGGARVGAGRPKKGEKREPRNQGDNITLKERGTSRAYILARLDRDGHTELAAKVRAGTLSANAAAIEAGYRKKPLRRCPECGHEW